MSPGLEELGILSVRGFQGTWKGPESIGHRDRNDPVMGVGSREWASAGAENQWS